MLIQVGVLLIRFGLGLMILCSYPLLKWFFGLVEHLNRGGVLKYECSFFYFSYDRDGFLVELGNIDKPSSMLSLFYMSKRAFHVLEE